MRVYGRLVLTLPMGPSPIFRRTSTRSWTTLRRARASMPMMIIAPRRCCFGSGRSEPRAGALALDGGGQSFIMLTINLP